MTAAPEPAPERAHWTNYEATFYYGELPEAASARVKVTEGRETLADLPALIARAHRESYPDPDKIAIAGIEVTCSTRIGDLLAPWLGEIANARTQRALRAVADGASATCVIGPRAKRRAEAEVLTRRLREREAELTAAPVAHTCNDGQGPFFGRRTDGCPRCEQLGRGAAPVRWRRPQDQYRPHECTERCGPVCTANDW
jgi:hypothetical protein